MSRRLFLLICSVAMIAIAGCARPDRARPGQRAYFGPTESMYDVVAQINQNNAAIPSVRATGYFEANVVEEPGGRSQFVNGDVTVLFRRPREVRLVGEKPMAGRIFDAASNGEQYWLIVRGQTDTMWHGRLDNLDQVDSSQIPIRPDVLVEILGVSEIERDFLQMPAPTMRFNNDADAYMFNFNIRLPDRWAVQKEVWYDRQTKLPSLILLFDEHGRIVVRTYLLNHQPVETGRGGESPRMATRYQIFFPDTGTRMRIDLDNLALQGGRPPAPNDATFAFPASPGVSRQINLDEQARF